MRATGFVAPMPGYTQASAFFRAVGFDVLDEAILYERETSGAPAASLGAFTPRPYDGADDARNAEIAALHRRSYRGGFGVPGLGAGGIRSWCAAMTCLVLEDAGRLAGCAFVNLAPQEAAVAAITVSRRYWGTGAADALVDAMTALARDHGRARIVGGVHRANHPSRAMVARHGFRESACVPYLARRLGSARG